MSSHRAVSAGRSKPTIFLAETAYVGYVRSRRSVGNNSGRSYLECKPLNPGLQGIYGTRERGQFNGVLFGDCAHKLKTFRFIFRDLRFQIQGRSTMPLPIFSPLFLFPNSYLTLAKAATESVKILFCGCWIINITRDVVVEGAKESLLFELCQRESISQSVNEIRIAGKKPSK